MPECIVCGGPTARLSMERVTPLQLSVPVHKKCEDKTRRNHLYGLMSRISEDDLERLRQVERAMAGDEDQLRDLTEESLGTRDLDEADRRARVIWEWQGKYD